MTVFPLPCLKLSRGLDRDEPPEKPSQDCRSHPKRMVYLAPDEAPLSHHPQVRLWYRCRLVPLSVVRSCLPLSDSAWASLNAFFAPTLCTSPLLFSYSDHSSPVIVCLPRESDEIGSNLIDLSVSFRQLILEPLDVSGLLILQPLGLASDGGLQLSFSATFQPNTGKVGDPERLTERLHLKGRITKFSTGHYN